MKIIDKNTDFYDYLQNVYIDPRIVFDRTDSFLLSKHLIIEKMNYKNWRYPEELNHCRFLLLQVCNTFWLFNLYASEFYSNGDIADFDASLIVTWKDYQKPRTLIQLELIGFNWNINRQIYKHKETLKDISNLLVQTIETNNYETLHSFNRERVYTAGNNTVIKHIPLLKASGISSLINPLDIYLSLEEYFSLEKTSSERSASIGITDKEKLENHGFDNKISFRGKN